MSAQSTLVQLDSEHAASSDPMSSALLEVVDFMPTIPNVGQFLLDNTTALHRQTNSLIEATTNFVDYTLRPP